MSYGDEIMAAGQAEALFRRDGRRVAIVDKRGLLRWSEVWANNPAILTPEEARRTSDRAELRNGPGCRPYVAYPFTRQSGQRFTAWRARDEPGRIHFDEAERRFGGAFDEALGAFVVIEPNVPEKSNANKDWGFARWQAVADLLAGKVRLLQVGPVGTRRLAGVTHAPTPSFRHGCAVLAHARAYLGVEGGLHHAAAALGVKGVVLFGGVVPPETTGYPIHVNIADRGEGSPCGRWMPCDHCAEAWARITPEQVADTLLKVLA